MPTVSWSTFATGARQLVVHETLLTMWWRLGVVDLVEVDSQHQVGIGRLTALDRGGHDDLAGTGVDVAGGVCARTKPARGLDDDVGAQLPPRRPSVLVLDDLDPPVGDDERSVLHSTGWAKRP